MPLETFSPPTNPSFPYDESTMILTDRIPQQKGYESSRSLLLREIRPSVRLHWNRAPEATLFYIESFFRNLNGSNGPFWWIPFDKIASPTAESPTLTQFIDGSLGAKTYYVVFTWYDSSYGETTQSVQSSISVLANRYMRAEVPVFPTFCEGWRVYAHETSGQECLQATVTTSQTWEQSGALSTGTATPPSTNNLLVKKKWLLIGGIKKTRVDVGRWAIDLEFSEQII